MENALLVATLLPPESRDVHTYTDIGSNTSDISVSKNNYQPVK